MHLEYFHRVIHSLIDLILGGISSSLNENLPPVEVRARFARAGWATLLLLVSPTATMSKVPAFTAALLYSLNLLVGILSCCEISVGVWTPLFNIDRAVT